MIDRPACETCSDGERYAAPTLVRHGDVDELTRGTGGPIPDAAAPGSFLPVRPTPIP